MFPLLISLFILTISIFYYLLTRRSLPPGPNGFPIVGCIPYVRPSIAHLTLEHWCRQYGPLISFYMGDTLVVVLGDCDVMREALVKKGDVFNGRSVIRAFRANRISQGIGLTGAEGELWREQRRFCLKSLRDFGVGRSVIEPKIQKEVEYLCREITTQNGRPFDIQSYLHCAIANIIMQFVFGRRFDYTDQIYIDYLSLITYRSSLSGINAFSAFNFLPWLLELPGENNAKKVISDGAKLLEFLQLCIEEKRRQLETVEPSHDDSPLDYVSAFLKAQSNGDGRYFTDDQLLIAVQQLFIAGSETTTTSLRWCLWHLCRFPEFQERIYQEIKNLTHGDKNCFLSWSDRGRTPFTEACICEIERLYTLCPFAVIHRTLTETELRGYYIPKDAYVVPFLWAIHRDPAHFLNPDTFLPERFLDSDGKFSKSVSFLPFGAGPRVCPGEALAKMEIYLFLTTLIQRFRFRFSSDNVQEMSKRQHAVGAIISPAPFDLIAEER